MSNPIREWLRAVFSLSASFLGMIVGLCGSLYIMVWLNLFTDRLGYVALILVSVSFIVSAVRLTQDDVVFAEHTREIPMFFIWWTLAVPGGMWSIVSAVVDDLRPGYAIRIDTL